MMSDDIVYWAGFFDGEGHIEMTYKKPTYSNAYGQYGMQVWIVQTAVGKQYYDDLAEFGGTVNEISQNGSTPEERWTISGSRAKEFLQTILPYLRKKRRECELAIELQERLGKFKLSGLTRGGHFEQLKNEIRVRDAILKEFYALPKPYGSKREHRLGENYLFLRLGQSAPVAKPGR